MNSLPSRMSEALTLQLVELQRSGASLFLLTLMFGYLPGYKRYPEKALSELEQRIQILWSGLICRLFNNPRTCKGFGVGFFDLGSTNEANRGLHCHVILALDEKRFKGKYRDGFLKYWQMEESRWINRARKSSCERPDPIVRSHLISFDGSEAGIRYCAKSIGEGQTSGLGLGSVVYLCCES